MVFKVIIPTDEAKCLMANYSDVYALQLRAYYDMKKRTLFGVYCHVKTHMTSQYWVPYKEHPKRLTKKEEELILPFIEY